MSNITSPVNIIINNGHLVYVSENSPFKPMENKEWLDCVNKILKTTKPVGN